MGLHPQRQPLDGPAVWRSGELQPHEWIVQLGDVERDAIVRATRSAMATGTSAGRLAERALANAELSSLAAGWSERLRVGRGVVLIRNFPIDLLTADETEAAFVGLGQMLGRPVAQNGAGDLLTHIIDERLPEAGPQVRLYRTRQRQDFHTDGADIIGLLCLHTARRGGESRIVSSAAIYNELLRRRPDLLDVLHRPMYWDRQGDDAVGAQRWFELAPINEVNGVPTLFYIGWYIRDAQRHADVPRLTAIQLEAMELLEGIANDPTFHLEMEFRPGDIQLLNNGRVLHAREAYEDHDDPALRRHLLRLWLAAHSFVSVDDGLRAGIGQR